MKRACEIIIVVLFFAMPVAAQDKHGDVVVHSDPRLSILMKKKKEVLASVTKPVVKRTAPVSTAVTTSVTTTAAGNKAIASSGPGVAGSSATNAPAANIPVSNTPATNTPPVAGATAAVPVATPPPADAVNNKPEPARVVVTAPIYIREKEGRVIYSGKGYRVLIYNGPDREKAIQIKMEFMRNFPGIRTYLSYVAPGYRVKVGNYRHREEALGMYKEAKGIYGPCVIVPDMITINTH